MTPVTPVRHVGAIPGDAELAGAEASEELWKRFGHCQPPSHALRFLSPAAHQRNG